MDQLHLTVLTGHVLGVTSIAFSPDGETLASCSWDSTVRLWDLHSGEDEIISAGYTGGVTSATGHTRGVTSVAFSPDGRTQQK